MRVDVCACLYACAQGSCVHIIRNVCLFLCICLWHTLVTSALHVQCTQMHEVSVWVEIFHKHTDYMKGKKGLLTSLKSSFKVLAHSKNSGKCQQKHALLASTQVSASLYYWNFRSVLASIQKHLLSTFCSKTSIALAFKMTSSCQITTIYTCFFVFLFLNDSVQVMQMNTH